MEGHDSRSGEMNIFFYTPHPLKAFVEVEALLCGHDCWNDIRAAFRKALDEPFTVIWPSGMGGFKVI